jgi:hypothetical protein
VANSVKQSTIEHIGDGALVGDGRKDAVDDTPMWVALAAGTCRSRGAIRPAHHLDDIGEPSVAKTGQHVTDEAGSDERAGTDLNIDDARQQLRAGPADVGERLFRRQDVPR